MKNSTQPSTTNAQAVELTTPSTAPSQALVQDSMGKWVVPELVEHERKHWAYLQSMTPEQLRSRRVF